MFRIPCQQPLYILTMQKTTDEILMKTLSRLDKEHYFRDFNQEVDMQANSRLRVDAHKYYKEKITKPFSVKNEADYLQRIQQARRIYRLRNKTEQIDYFTWNRHKLLFKGQQIPEIATPGKHHALTNFNRKTFVSSQYNDFIPDNAQLEFFQLRRRIKTECDDEQREVESKTQQRVTPDYPNINKLKKWSSQRAPRLVPRHRPRKSTGYEIKTKPIVEKVPSIKNNLSFNFTDFIGKAIMKVVDQGRIYDRLKELCQGLTSKYSLRIYRQQFRRLFIQRYGRDRITGFMDMQYIQDYKSIVEMIHKMSDMNQQQILYLTFVSFDYNKDNLITNSDLSELFQYSLENRLLETDLFRIINFIKNRKIIDKQSNPELFATELNYQTLKMVKEDEDKEKSSPKKVINFMKKQVFTMLAQSQNMPVGRKRQREDSSRNDGTPSEHLISINFETFKRIFGEDRPCFFYDLLYVLAGIQYKHLIYPPQQYIKIEQTPQSQQKSLEAPLQRFQKIVSRMREETRDIPSLLL